MSHAGKLGYSHGLPSALQSGLWLIGPLSSRCPVSGGVPRVWGTGGYPGTRQVVKSRPTLRSRIDHRGLAAVSDASPLALDSATLLMFDLAFMSAFMWSFAFVICICMYLTPSASSLGLFAFVLWRNLNIGVLGILEECSLVLLVAAMWAHGREWVQGRDGRWYTWAYGLHHSGQWKYFLHS